MSCARTISAGVPKDCAAINAATGVNKDLILVNFEEYDNVATLADSNFEADDTNNNKDGLTAIHLKSGATQHTFEGTDYSVMPTVTSENRDDGDAWFLHSIAFTVYSKSSETRKVLRDLSNSKVIAIVIDRSTGLYELFGAEHGLKMSELSREYVGNQNSNFYPLTIATPDVAVVRESNLGYLSHQITVAT